MKSSEWRRRMSLGSMIISSHVMHSTKIVSSTSLGALEAQLTCHQPISDGVGNALLVRYTLKKQFSPARHANTKYVLFMRQRCTKARHATSTIVDAELKTRAPRKQQVFRRFANFPKSVLDQTVFTTSRRTMAAII
jgi:hypothetical protein